MSREECGALRASHACLSLTMAVLFSGAHALGENLSHLPAKTIRCAACNACGCSCFFLKGARLDVSVVPHLPRRLARNGRGRRPHRRRRAAKAVAKPHVAAVFRGAKPRRGPAAPSLRLGRSHPRVGLGRWRRVQAEPARHDDSAQRAPFARAPFARRPLQLQVLAAPGGQRRLGPPQGEAGDDDGLLLVACLSRARDFRVRATAAKQ